MYVLESVNYLYILRIQLLCPGNVFFYAPMLCYNHKYVRIIVYIALNNVCDLVIAVNWKYFFSYCTTALVIKYHVYIILIICIVEVLTFPWLIRKLFFLNIFYSWRKHEIKSLEIFYEPIESSHRWEKTRQY